MILRHLFRSEKLITLMNRLGHSENYSFSLELETAIAQSVAEMSSVLSNQIIRNPQVPAVFHSEFDNFDQVLNTLTGMYYIHTAHGIMLQDAPRDHSHHEVGTAEASSQARTGQRSFQLAPAEELPPCYITLRCSPVLTINRLSFPEGDDEVEKSMIRQILWVMIRIHQHTQQTITGWSGFISATGVTPENTTIIDYYPVIVKPITQYQTVQQCLRYAEQATLEVGQDYVITTFDLGVCMKAFPIIWKNPGRYEKHIILTGTFHLACAYLKMIGKKMQGSGLSDVLIETGLIGSGSVQGVMSGRHYERAMHCHKIMIECLERLLPEQYLKHCGDEKIFDSLSADSQHKLAVLAMSLDEDTLARAMEDESIGEYVRSYMAIRNEVRSGLLGRTAQLWTSYMDHIHLILFLVESVKRNNFELYAHTLELMANLFFSFVGQNYARYLTYFGVFLANIDVSHPGAVDLLRRGAISVARSFVSGNRCDVDKTMEETFMKHTKSKGGAGGSGAGVSGLLSNYNTYQRWVRTTHERSQFVNATLNFVGMGDTTDGMKHRDLRPTEIKRSEKFVSKAEATIRSFTNPFDVRNKESLIIISSGAVARPDISRDVLNAEEIGKSAKEDFISQRLQHGKDFFEPIKRLNLKTLDDMSKKVTVTTSYNKVVQFKQQGNIAFALLVKSQSMGLKLDLQQLMEYPLTPVPYSISTADGALAKTDKSKSMQYMLKDVDNATPPEAQDTFVIHDGNAFFYYMKDLPPNFGKIGTSVFEMMPAKSCGVFSTDSYHKNSIKTLERARRGQSAQLIVGGPSTKRPSDWKQFLGNSENKQNFTELLRTEWSSDRYASKLQNREVVLICDGKATLLTSDDGVSTKSTGMIITGGE